MIRYHRAVLLAMFVTIWLALAQTMLSAPVSDLPYGWQQEMEAGRMLVNVGSDPSAYLMPSVGNGYLAHVIDGSSIFVAGLYNGPAVATHPTHRASLANVQSVKVGGKLNAGGLAMNDGTFARVYSVGSNCFVTQTFYAHRYRRNLLVQSIEVDNRLGSVKCQVSLQTVTEPSNDVLLLQTSQRSNYSIATYRTQQSEMLGGILPVIAVATTTVSPVSVEAGLLATFPILTTIYTSLESSNPDLEAELAYLDALAQFPQQLYEDHAAQWNSLWQARIEVQGNLPLAQVINSSLYYLLSSVREDSPWSLSPGGLASNLYNSHVFWDSETWMYPPLLAFWPKIADRSVLRYRLDHIAGAKDKARSYGKGWKGLMYPWESAYTGMEVTPTWAATGELEQHITGDIAFAIRQYYYATGDLNWLSEYYEVILGIGEFWKSRVVASTSNSLPSSTKNSPNKDGTRQMQYVINNVIPPDEYAVGVNNSVYTNYVAGLSLDWLARASQLLGEPVDPSWQQIASNLKIPFDPTQQIHLEYDGYAGQRIKQADVVLLGYPLEMTMPKQIRSNDLAYYESRTDPEGPAMTWAMHAVGWLELGRPDKAQPMFVRGYANSHPPYGVWTETPSGTGVNFLTGAGGFLQSVISGYGGLRIKEKRFDFATSLPANTESLALVGLSLCGSQFNVRWNSTHNVITATNMFSSPLMVSFSNGPSSLLTVDQDFALPAGTPFSITGQ
jgi:trehalose/maltose hydrolase-like predicted phosphorylase